jgi:hypothetical protein
LQEPERALPERLDHTNEVLSPLKKIVLAKAGVARTFIEDQKRIFGDFNYFGLATSITPLPTFGRMIFCPHQFTPESASLPMNSWAL